MNIPLLMLSLVCCLAVWGPSRRVASGNRLASVAAVPMVILADVAPDPYFSEQRNGPIAVIIAVIVAVLIIGIGVWRAIKRGRRERVDW